MKTPLVLFIIFVVGFGIGAFWTVSQKATSTAKTEIIPVTLGQQTTAEAEKEYWLVLHRKSKREDLYLGNEVVASFQVNPGVKGKTPTPLPELLGREYWLITAKRDSSLNPDTSPYFLSLDIPGWQETPFGPSPYLECDGQQCNWGKDGEFGLHGIGGEPDKLFDGGSLGCIRHKDEDITYLYNLLDLNKGPIKYFVYDN